VHVLKFLKSIPQFIKRSLTVFIVHHAGMLRGDRKLTEQMFSDGAIKVLCCTATLAWGINLPAHSVVIKGTEVYNPEKGRAIDLSILDVCQIFGRAGRPQFDNSGEATMITTHEAYQRYIDKLIRAVPIESNFIKQLPDHLNAEIVGGTVASISDAVSWLEYTYLYVRMLRNPLAYGISADEKADDPRLHGRCAELITNAAKWLDENKMIRYAESGNLAATERGRVASNFYVQSESVAVFGEKMDMLYTTKDADILRIVSAASEFKNMRVRQEEQVELEKLMKDSDTCPMHLSGAGLDDAGKGLITGTADKTFVLMQAYISRAKVSSFTLMSDVNYISANAGRIARALFEMCLKGKKAAPALQLLRLAKSVDHQIWWFKTPLRQFEGELSETVLKRLEMHCTGKIFESTLTLLDLQPRELGQLCNFAKGGDTILGLIRALPRFEIECKLLPITTSVLRIRINLCSAFAWRVRWHGGAQSFWLWIENSADGRVLHYEQLTITKRLYPDPIIIETPLPTFGASNGEYTVRVIADSWIGVEHEIPVRFNASMMPKEESILTKLQDLTPLPVSALNNVTYEKLYPFTSFNPIQTQLFHVLYHTDAPVLLGAPTGSGKTIMAEIAILRMKQRNSNGICVYIAPLKALARERLREWKQKFGGAPLHWKVLELSGDTHYEPSMLERSDILVCTPEKWDLITRTWRGVKGKLFIKRVNLLVLDEVHLLGEERGAVLEAIVSRTRFISRLIQQEQGRESKLTRIIGLSTALANAVDLADWIGIHTKGIGRTVKRGLYNFHPSVRPVPITVHIQGFSGKHYCPRMATMNKYVMYWL
jgi:activating signal cointegrator complex subunit 3